MRIIIIAGILKGTITCSQRDPGTIRVYILRNAGINPRFPGELERYENIVIKDRKLLTVTSDGNAGIFRHHRDRTVIIPAQP